MIEDSLGNMRQTREIDIGSHIGSKMDVGKFPAIEIDEEFNDIEIMNQNEETHIKIVMM